MTSFDSITAQLSPSLRKEARKNESFVDAAASMEQPQGEQTAGNNEASSAQQEEPANNEQHTPQLSREERNALNRAERYLSSNAFSQSSLKRQLLYEDFSERRSDFAVATVDADWNEQALKKQFATRKIYPYQMSVWRANFPLKALLLNKLNTP